MAQFGITGQTTHQNCLVEHAQFTALVIQADDDRTHDAVRDLVDTVQLSRELRLGLKTDQRVNALRDALLLRGTEDHVQQPLPLGEQEVQGPQPEESTWNLKDVFESDEAWQAEYEALKAVPEQIEAFRGRLGESAETLLEWFRLNDVLSVLTARTISSGWGKFLSSSTGLKGEQMFRPQTRSTGVIVSNVMR